jgi:probable lipoprotein NlpC
MTGNCRLLLFGGYMAHWSSFYIGIPHCDRGTTREGLNCWTLVCLVYREHLGISLPTYQDAFVSLDEHREVDALFHGERAREPWMVVDQPSAFDVAVFRRGRHLTHVGLVVRNGVMLHVTAGRAAAIERYDSGQWAPRLQHLYRHVDAVPALAAEAA